MVKSESVSSRILRNSILVVAHPDDEVLWFSSILREVNQVIICYSDEISDPDFGVQRINSLKNYPLKNTSYFELASIGVLRPQSFVSPKFNRYGIELIGKDNPAHTERYKENYYEIRKKLVDVLSQYENVITHNPWGEYGHEEHVQVYRVVNELQAGLGFNLWHSNYCSTRTINMVAQCMCIEELITLPTDEGITKDLMEHYKRHKCWTWDDNWCWQAKETFFRQKPDALHGACNTEKNHIIQHNSAIPLDLILMSPVAQQFRGKRLSMFKRLISLVRKLKKYHKG